MNEIKKCEHGRLLTKTCWRCIVATKDGLVGLADKQDGAEQ